MKRLALVTPSSGPRYAPAGGSMPTPILFLAAYVRKELPDWEVQIIDSNFEDPARRLLSEHWDAAGISAMTAQYESATTLAKLLRVKSGFPVIIGGVHITTAPWSLRDVFDVVIPGEGEAGLVQYLRTGIAPTKQILADLHGYPDLDYSMVDPRYFTKHVSRGWQAEVVDAMVIPSRGCPYHCRFCAQTGAPYRKHDVDWVVRQVSQLVARGVTHFELWDDLFTSSPKYVQQMSDAFVKAGLHKAIKGIAIHARANTMTPEVCDALSRMGVRLVSFGFESMNERMLRYLKVSGVSVQTNYRAVRLVRDAGMLPSSSFMFGSPTETLREMLSTAWGMLRLFFLGMDDLIIFVTTPFPGTEFWKIADDRGRLEDVKQNWDLLKTGSKLPGNARLTDLPRWKFLIGWWIAQLATVPYKIKKAMKVAPWKWLKSRA